MFWIGVSFGLVGLAVFLGTKLSAARIVGGVLMGVGAVVALYSYYGAGTGDEMMGALQRALPNRIGEEIDDSQFKDGAIAVYVEQAVQPDGEGELDASISEYYRRFADVIARKTGRETVVVPVKFTIENGSPSLYEDENGETGFSLGTVPSDANVFVLLTPRMDKFANTILSTPIWKERVSGGKGGLILVNQRFDSLSRNDKNKIASGVICYIDNNPEAAKYMPDLSMGLDELFERQYVLKKVEKD